MVISMNMNEVLFMNNFASDYLDKNIDSKFRENSILITKDNLVKSYLSFPSLFNSLVLKTPCNIIFIAGRSYQT